jgi:hypothetical protein
VPPASRPASTSYPLFEQEHKPTGWGIALGRAITWTKIWAICGVLKVLGKTKEARMLTNAYTAFTVYNTPRYDRSILSAVDNGLALRVSACSEAAALCGRTLKLACSQRGDPG